MPIPGLPVELHSEIIKHVPSMTSGSLYPLLFVSKMYNMEASRQLYHTMTHNPSKPPQCIVNGFQRASKLPWLATRINQIDIEKYDAADDSTYGPLLASALSSVYPLVINLKTLVLPKFQNLQLMPAPTVPFQLHIFSLAFSEYCHVNLVKKFTEFLSGQHQMMGLTVVDGDGGVLDSDNDLFNTASFRVSSSALKDLCDLTAPLNLAAVLFPGRSIVTYDCSGCHTYAENVDCGSLALLRACNIEDLELFEDCFFALEELEVCVGTFEDIMPFLDELSGIDILSLNFLYGIPDPLHIETVFDASPSLRLLELIGSGESRSFIRERDSPIIEVPEYDDPRDYIRG